MNVFSTIGLFFKKIFYYVAVALVTLFFLIDGWHVSFPNQYAERLDLSDREIVWQDEFDGDSIDTTKWEVFDTNGHTTFFTPDQVTVSDGCARLRIEYHKDGKFGDGFYGGWLSTANTFRYTYGYYEIRCKMPKGEGLHAAFWTYQDELWKYDYTADKGTEIDIFENAYYRVNDRPEIINNTYTIALHAGDGLGNHLGTGSDKICTLEGDGTNMYDTFHTYGLEWTENEYIFYYDGIEVERFDFSKGDIDGISCTCKEPMFLYVSTHVGTQVRDDGSIRDEWNGNAFNNPEGTFPTDFVVDYVRVYAPLSK